MDRDPLKPIMQSSIDPTVDGLRARHGYGELMSRSQETLSTGVTVWDVLLVLAAGAAGGVAAGNFSVALVCAILASVAAGVWRLVRFAGKILEYVQASSEGAYEPDLTEG
jgi:hypothetical protein